MKNHPSMDQKIGIWVVWLLATIAILYGSYYSPGGYLSWDSNVYLRVAQNLLDGNGLYMNIGIQINSFSKDEYFSAFPPLYPLLISMISIATGTGVMLASKILSVILIGIILHLLSIIFESKRFLYGAVVLLAGFLWVFSFSWSELPYIALMLGFTYTLFQVLNGDNSVLRFSLLVLLSTCMFFTRYIGFYALIISAMIYLMDLAINQKNDFYKMIILTSSSILVIGFLLFGLSENGHLTGLVRTNGYESHLEMFTQVAMAILNELSFLTINGEINSIIRVLVAQAIIFLIIMFFIKKNKLSKSDQHNKKYPIWLVFCAVGLVHMVVLITLRWNIHFDPIDTRLLSPAKFLIIISLMLYIKNRTRWENRVGWFLITVSLLSYIIHIANLPLPSDKKFINHEVSLINSHKNIPKGSIVILPPPQMIRLRPDLLFTYPISVPYGTKKETWSEFMHRVNPGNHKRMFIVGPHRILSDRGDKSKGSIYDSGIVNKLNKLIIRSNTVGLVEIKKDLYDFQ